MSATIGSETYYTPDDVWVAFGGRISGESKDTGGVNDQETANNVASLLGRISGLWTLGSDGKYYTTKSALTKAGQENWFPDTTLVKATGSDKALSTSDVWTAFQPLKYSVGTKDNPETELGGLLGNVLARVSGLWTQGSDGNYYTTKNLLSAAAVKNWYPMATSSQTQNQTTKSTSTTTTGSKLADNLLSESQKQLVSNIKSYLDPLVSAYSSIENSLTGVQTAANTAAVQSAAANTAATQASATTSASTSTKTWLYVVIGAGLLLLFIFRKKILK